MFRRDPASSRLEKMALNWFFFCVGRAHEQRVGARDEGESGAAELSRDQLSQEARGEGGLMDGDARVQVRFEGDVGSRP